MKRRLSSLVGIITIVLISTAGFGTRDIVKTLAQDETSIQVQPVELPPIHKLTIGSIEALVPPVVVLETRFVSENWNDLVAVSGTRHCKLSEPIRGPPDSV